MKHLKQICVALMLVLSYNLFAQKTQATVEAEFDTLFNYQFESLKEQHGKKVLIDQSHNTIYSLSYGKQTAREMLRIMGADGYNVNFTDENLDSNKLNETSPDLLIIHGVPNDQIVLNNGGKTEILYKSPIKDQEVIDIATYVYNGGSLMLYLSHFPGGSGALPLLEAFSVKFRDGYASHPDSPGHNGDRCSHFIMTPTNGMMNMKHPVFANAKSETFYQIL